MQNAETGARRTQLMERMERKRAARNWPSPMCGSCCQNEACPGGRTRGSKCLDYLPPEPTHLEWPEIYKEAIRMSKEPYEVQTQIHRIGRVNAIRDAMHRIHGFTLEEIETIEAEEGGRGA